MKLSDAEIRYINEKFETTFTLAEKLKLSTAYEELRLVLQIDATEFKRFCIRHHRQ